jgi:hypothetical protein
MKTDTSNKQDEAQNGGELRDCPDSAGSDFAEAIASIRKIRMQLEQDRHEAASRGHWMRWDEQWNQHTKEIEEMDKRLDALLRGLVLPEITYSQNVKHYRD